MTALPPEGKVETESEPNPRAAGPVRKGPFFSARLIFPEPGAWVCTDNRPECCSRLMSPVVTAWITLSGTNPPSTSVRIVCAWLAITWASSSASACRALTPLTSYQSSAPLGAGTSLANARTASTHSGRIVRSAKARCAVE